MKIRITLKQKLYIVAGIVVIALTSTYFLVYRGQLKKIKELQNQLNIIEGNLSKVRKEKEILPHLLEEIVQAQQKIEVIKAQMPYEKQTPELIEELAGLANRIGIQDYISISFGGFAGIEAYNILPLNINLRCTYPKFIDFLLGLEKLKRLIRIENMYLRAFTADPLQIEVNLKITAFVLAPPKKK